MGSMLAVILCVTINQMGYVKANRSVRTEHSKAANVHNVCNSIIHLSIGPLGI